MNFNRQFSYLKKKKNYIEKSFSVEIKFLIFPLLLNKNKLIRFTTLISF